MRPACEVYRCTLFGTQQAWDIPDVLRGGRRGSNAFKAWYMAQVRLTRKSLAARGNIEACKAIRETKHRSRLYMKWYRDHQRRIQQVVAQQRELAPLLEHEENVD